MLGEDAGASLSLVQGTPFCLLARDYITQHLQQEGSEAGVTPQSLAKAETRTRCNYVAWLQDNGLQGIFQFLCLYVGAFAAAKK